MAMNTMSAVLSNAALETLIRYIGDLEFELSEVPSALITGAIVGASSLFGALIGGRFGLIVGGGIGHQINNYLLPKIRNVGNMVRELPLDVLRNLIDLLIRGIKITVSTVLVKVINQNLHLTDLIDRFSSHFEVRMNVIQTLINFFSGIHGSTLRQVAP